MTLLTTSCWASILFTIGAVGVLIRRNAMVLFMGIELMFNAANLALVTFSRINGYARRPDHGVVRDGRGGGRGGRRAGDRHGDVPDRRSASVDDENLLRY